MTVQEMLDDCKLCEDDLTDWECEFIGNLLEQVAEGRNLSKSQLEKLEQIWEERT